MESASGGEEMESAAIVENAARVAKYS